MNSLRYVQIAGCILFIMNVISFSRQINETEMRAKNRESEQTLLRNNKANISENDSKIRRLENQIEDLNSTVNFKSISASQYFALALILFPQLVIWNNANKIKSERK